MFLSPNALERLFLLSNYRVAPFYFVCKLPSTASIEIQLTFKKLITMSKTFLCDEPVRPTGCFCQDCIAELEVPLTFKLQFLEEAAEEKRKIKKGRKTKTQGKQVPEPVKDEEQNRKDLDELVLEHRKELKNFWSSFSSLFPSLFSISFSSSFLLFFFSSTSFPVFCPSPSSSFLIHPFFHAGPPSLSRRSGV